MFKRAGLLRGKAGPGGGSGGSGSGGPPRAARPVARATLLLGALGVAAALVQALLTTVRAGGGHGGGYGQAAGAAGERQQECMATWDRTVEKMLAQIPAGSVSLRNYVDLPARVKFRDSLLLLKVQGGQLSCLDAPAHPAEHVSIHRISSFVRQLQGTLATYGRTLPDVALWVHMGDEPQIAEERADGPGHLPLVGVVQGKGYHDLGALPFFGLFDWITAGERRQFAKARRNGGSHRARWQRKDDGIFFHGAPSSGKRLEVIRDVITALRPRGMNLKVKICEKSQPQIDHIDTVMSEGMKPPCEGCTAWCIKPDEHAQRLVANKIVLDVPGNGPWSRRLSTLLTSGSVPLVYKGNMDQFYTVPLEAGRHFVQFDEADVHEVAQGLLDDDARAQAIAEAAETFGANCLQEESIQYFLAAFLRGLSKRLAFGVAELDHVPGLRARQPLPASNVFEWERRLWVKKCYGP